MDKDLQKPLLDPENFNREGIDLECLPLDDIFEHLRTSREGLSSEEAGARLKIFGVNKLEEKPENKILKFLSFMWNPLSWVMEAAAVMAIVLANGGGPGPDWQDFLGIICLLFINSAISFVEENNAGNAAGALMARLAPTTKVLRDGRWQEQDAAILVPGDIISIKLGDIIPADARLLEGDPLKIDQSALTGESLPVTKRTGDEVFSGSTCKHGEIEAVVIATGVHSFFGKAAHLVDSTEVVGHFQKVLTSIGNFCICSIAVGMILEIIVMFPIQQRSYRSGINNLLVLLIGGIPIAMPTVLSVTLAIGSHRLSQQGAITKRMTAIEEMAGMDVLCSDKTGTLTLNRLVVDRSLIEVLYKDMDKDMVVLLAARAARLENQDAIDAAIINMLEDPKEARANIKEVHFLPFNPVDKRTAITYIDSDGKWYRASKGAPEQILDLCQEKQEISGKVHTIINKFAERGLRSLGVAFQEVPENSKDSSGGPWLFCGLLPLFDPPRHDSAETIRRALNLGVCVKMITGDQLAIAKETGRRLGMGTNMYPSSALLSRDKDEHEVLPVDELIEKADGFAGVFPEHKYEIVKILQGKKHVCGMTGDGVNDAPALKKADIGIAVADATDAARGAADIVLTEPGLSVIISAVLTSRAIFQRMKNYTIYAVSITIRIVLGFTLLALIWKFDFPPFMVPIIAILNDGTIMTISKDRVKPSLKPDSWKLNEIFATGIVIGSYLALVTVFFYWVARGTTFFETYFHVRSLSGNTEEIASAIYLQVSIISQALIFVTRTQSWSFLERPGALLIFAFVVAQLANMESMMRSRELTETRMMQALREELSSAERRAEEERAAHNATKMAAMEREVELEHRALDASTALARIQRTADERTAKAVDLEQKVALLEVECSSLNQELQDMEARVRREQKKSPDEANQVIQMQAWQEEVERARQGQRDAESKLSSLEAELQKMRVEMAAMKRDAEHYSRQEHMELEKRYRELTDLLYYKQTQLEAMTSEKAAAEFQLEKEKKRIQEAQVEVERSRSSRRASSSWEEDTDMKALEPLPLHHRHMVGASEQLQKAVKFLDSGAVRATRFLWRYPTARLLLLFYLVFVHLFLMYLLHRLQEQADTFASREVAESMGLADHTLP